MYLEDAETLTLYQGQCKTKEDQYQRRIQALERLLFKYSRFGINQVIGLVTADNRYQEKYLAIDYYKYTKLLRYKPLPSLQQYRVIQVTKTATSFLSVRGIASAATSRQDKKRKRAIKAGPIPVDPPTTDIVDEEDDNDKPESTSKGNTRRASAIPLLALAQKKLSSAKILSYSIVRATTIATEVKLVPKKRASIARILMFAFYSSQTYANVYILTQDQQPQIVALYVEGNYKYRLRFIATIQSNNNTDNTFDRDVARIDLLRSRRQDQLERIAKVEKAGQRHFVTVIRRDAISNIDLNAIRPYKIRLLESNDKNTNKEVERRSEAALDILRAIVQVSIPSTIIVSTGRHSLLRYIQELYIIILYSYSRHSDRQVFLYPAYSPRD